MNGAVVVHVDLDAVCSMIPRSPCACPMTSANLIFARYKGVNTRRVA